MKFMNFMPLFFSFGGYLCYVHMSCFYDIYLAKHCGDSSLLESVETTETVSKH